MKVWLTGIAAAAVVAVMTGGQPVQAAGCPAPDGGQTTAAVAAINALRARAGQAPVTADPRLSVVAAAQACAMAAGGRMVHSGSGRGPGAALRQAGYDWRYTAENVAAGPFDLRAVMAAWAGSPGHRANLLDPRARHVGIAAAVGPDQRTRFWAAVVAAPR